VNKEYKAHRGGKETLGRRALYERIMAYAVANGHQATKDLRNFYGLDLAEQPLVRAWWQREGRA
jgi:hypothetical protein